MCCALFPLISAQMMRKAVANESKVARACFDSVCASARIVQQNVNFHPRDMRTC